MHELTDTHSPAPPLVAIFILSATALAYEVLLVRLFSIIHWSHFAFMVISIALLGYGASGSMITVFRERLLAHYDRVFILNIVLFGLSSIFCFVVVQHLPFNALEILWDRSQWLRLMLSYLLLTLPFFFVANAIALTLMRFHRQIPLIYGIDLIGAGAGSVAIMLLLLVLPPDIIIRVLGLTAITAGLFSLHMLAAGKRLKAASLLTVCMLSVFLIPQQWLDLRMSEYKGLSGTLLIKGAQRLQQHSSPISMIDVVESETVPFRNAPGLSLRNPADIPQQLAVFRDGDEMTTIVRYQGNGSLRYLDYMSSALPYNLHADPRRVLIMGSATGTNLLQAHYHGVQDISAVEPDAKLSELITEDFADYFGWQYLQDKVSLFTMTNRSFAARSSSDNTLTGIQTEKYDLVIMGPPGGSAGGAAGVHALAASYDLTVEAIHSYLRLLRPAGMLSITQWTSNPARGNLKLFVTAVTAMRQAGIDKPENHIAWIRSWNTATLVLKRTPLTQDEIDSVQAFCDSRSFDLAWLPGMKPEQANRYQLLQEPLYYLAADSIFNDSESTADTGHNFIEEYKYDIHAATDDSPYFDNFFRASGITELMSLPGSAGISLVGVGYPTLLVTIAQAAIAALVLIVLPLMFVRTRGDGVDRKRRNIVFYFLAIGLAFLFIELAFIQKFSLLIGQPLYAVAVVLSAFLVFSGLGSLYVEKRIEHKANQSAVLTGSVLTIVVTTLLYIVLLPLLGTYIMSQSEIVRFALAFIITAPIAFAMGMPFSLGLAAVQQNSPQLTAWAWGINGCASVLSAILAVLLAIEIGFSGVMLIAAGLYVIAWLNRI